MCANRLSYATQNGVAVTFAYGPDGARVKKSDGFKVTLYPDAGVEIDRSNSSSAVITRYPHADLKVVSNDSGSAVDWSYLHWDHLASVRIVTDSAGVVAEQTGYAAFGERGNEIMSTAKGYIGERFDPETGLPYLNAPYYDPKIARFIPADPQGEDPGQDPGQSKVQSEVQE